VMLSTHILSEAQQVCDRVLIINKGKIVAEDTPERLQARLAGVQKVLVKVAGDPDGLDGVVGGLPGVVRVSPSVDGGLELEMLPGQDLRPLIARTVISANYDLIELRQVSLSLEDIFIELTREEPEPPSIDEDAGLAETTASEEKDEFPEE
jgi:ABC-2 type transport system ATP-binding protein